MPKSKMPSWHQLLTNQPHKHPLLSDRCCFLGMCREYGTLVAFAALAYRDSTSRCIGGVVLYCPCEVECSSDVCLYCCWCSAVGRGTTKKICGVSFKGYGAHVDDYPHDYLTVACAIGTISACSWTLCSLKLALINLDARYDHFGGGRFRGASSRYSFGRSKEDGKEHQSQLRGSTPTCPTDQQQRSQD